MTRRRLFNFAIDEELAAGLKSVKRQDGISEAEQARRALRMWLESKGVKVKTERPRAITRKRS